MPSSYPDVPGSRIYYHKDGSIMWRANTAGGGVFSGGGIMTAMVLPPTELASTTKTEYNDEDSVTVESHSGPGDLDYGFGWVWPQKMDMHGFYGNVVNSVGNKVYEIYSSTNSRNAITGDWVIEAVRTGNTWYSTNDYPTLTLAAGHSYYSVEQSYREFIHALNTTGVDAVQARVQTNKTVGGQTDPDLFKAFHWYGSIADGANPDRILFIDADTGLEYDAVQDWGDIPRGSVHDKEIYLYNNSATLTASSNVLSFEGDYKSSYTWYTIRDESSTSGFSTTLNTTSIGPGARYPTASTDNLVVRLTVASTEELGVAAASLKLVTGSWA